jgi:hypothetical protein
MSIAAKPIASNPIGGAARATASAIASASGSSVVTGGSLSNFLGVGLATGSSVVSGSAAAIANFTFLSDSSATVLGSSLAGSPGTASAIGLSNVFGSGVTEFVTIASAVGTSNAFGASTNSTFSTVSSDSYATANGYSFTYNSGIANSRIGANTISGVQINQIPVISASANSSSNSTVNGYSIFFTASSATASGLTVVLGNSQAASIGAGNSIGGAVVTGYAPITTQGFVLSSGIGSSPIANSSIAGLQLSLTPTAGNSNGFASANASSPQFTTAAANANGTAIVVAIPNQAIQASFGIGSGPIGASSIAGTLVNNPGPKTVSATSYSAGYASVLAQTTQSIRRYGIASSPIATRPIAGATFIPAPSVTISASGVAAGSCTAIGSIRLVSLSPAAIIASGSSAVLGLGLGFSPAIGTASGLSLVNGFVSTSISSSGSADGQSIAQGVLTEIANAVALALSNSTVSALGVANVALTASASGYADSVFGINNVNVQSGAAISNDSFSTVLGQGIATSFSIGNATNGSIVQGQLFSIANSNFYANGFSNANVESAQQLLSFALFSAGYSNVTGVGNTVITVPVMAITSFPTKIPYSSSFIVNGTITVGGFTPLVGITPNKNFKPLMLAPAAVDSNGNWSVSLQATYSDFFIWAEAQTSPYIVTQSSLVTTFNGPPYSPIFGPETSNSYDASVEPSFRCQYSGQGSDATFYFGDTDGN